MWPQRSDLLLDMNVYTITGLTEMCGASKLHVLSLVHGIIRSRHVNVSTRVKQGGYIFKTCPSIDRIL